MGGFSIPNIGTASPYGGSEGDYAKSLLNAFNPATTGTFNTGQRILGAGLNTMQPSIDYWSAILSGNPQALTAATAPTANMLSTLYSGATNNASTGLPQGGYRSTMMAQLPFAQASQVGNYLLGLQPQAAQQLGQLGNTQSQIGLSETSQAQNLLQQMLQTILGIRGQNNQASASQLGAGAQLGSSLLNAASNAYANQPQSSDIRLKEGIVPLGMVEGIPVYAFRYKDDSEVRLGVMAQEVQTVRPDAVLEGPDGYLMVQYDKLFQGVN